MNRKDYQHGLARAAMVLLVAMLSVVTARAEVVNIGTVAEWNAFAARVNGGVTTLDGLLTADLDFSDQTFTVAGTSAHPYCGTFDGASHTLTGISVSKSGDMTANRQGLFGSIGTGGFVKNVTITGSSFAGWDYVGGIAGYNQGGTISNCHVTASVTIGTTAGSKYYHGGIVGYNSSVNSTVSHCTSAAIVINSDQTACHYFGGIVGGNLGGTVEYCLAVGATVSAVTSSGAIAGSNTGTLSHNYYANCRVGETTINIGTSNGDVSTNDGAVPAILLYDQGAEAVGNTTTISDNSGSEKNVVLYGRTLYKDGAWNTLCLPFALDNFTGTPLEDATVMTLGNSAGCDTGFDAQTGTLTLDFVGADRIEPGVAYIVKWGSGDNITNPVFAGVTIENEAPADHSTTSLDGAVGFVGSYSPVIISGEDREMLYLGSNNKLYYPNAAMQLGSFRAFFQLDGIIAGAPVAGVRSFVLNFGEDSANALTGFSECADKAAVYDLCGRRIPECQQLNAKGIFISNNKKIFK
ncbi:MAG: hypothetical protein J6P55_02825 [Bacteroidaceae bacterium]|nr:hypothetical protein [Bacteroidaceae bacterium]